ncbi:hypothetical protein [uncultured Paraglaciecola sp.]|uniref:hypothetical protein n=1 Tax=uncultured Paraglaciecola sp. TaxID=1765024 RepID=UPI0030D6D5E5|tara:strand:+ start:58398 stop:58721 length:324 start_codon:yes stop_codon:yes gene_type:complete
MKCSFVSSCCLLFLGLTTVVQALPTKCLQTVERQSVCPHLLYKKAALPVALLDIDQGEIICICLSDLKGLIRSASSKVERIDQQVTLQRIATDYQLSEQDILKLIRN